MTTGEKVVVADAEDVSGGVTSYLKNYRRVTFHIHVADAVDITVELSPDGGEHYFEIPESPLSYSAAGDDVNEVGYDANRIRITGSNTTSVTFIARGVYDG